MQSTSVGDAAPRSCANHPDRRPVGLCRVCASPVCSECHVRLDGILHCRACLAAAARGLGGPRRSAWPRVGAALAAVVLLVPALLLAQAALLVAGTMAGNLSRLRSAAPERQGTPPR